MSSPAPTITAPPAPTTPVPATPRVPRPAAALAAAGPSIVLERASRWYGQVIGLNDVSCFLGPGLTALLGPNGAGKSTLFKLVTGQLRPTTGRVLVGGLAPFANGNVFQRLGYCPEIDNFYEDMTGREFVTLLASLAGLRGPGRKARVDDAIERVGMSDRCDRKLGGYSKGMRQRIKVAQAIVHDPDILILDEPLNGLDPLGRRDMARLMTEFAQAGKCVLVSSHILYEVEQITDNVLLILRGRLVAQGDLHGLRDLMDRHPHHVSVTLADPSRVRALGSDLLRLPSVLGVRFDAQRPDRLEIETAQPDQFYTQLPDVALAGDYPVTDFHSPDNNLEAVFNYLVQG